MKELIEYIVKYADRKPKISDLLYAFNIRKNQAQEAFKDMIFMLIKTGKIIKSNTGVLEFAV